MGDMNQKAAHVLEIGGKANTWDPPKIDEYELISDKEDVRECCGYLFFIKTEPYIDSLYVEYDSEKRPARMRRFAFHEGYSWRREDELFFHDHCVRDSECLYSSDTLTGIYRYYDANHPEWHIRRYYSKGLRLLDHIYNCIKKNTAKEILYKAGLDELAVHIDGMDELNLFASSPSEIYEGLSMKVLRSLNCPCGAALVNGKNMRQFLKDLNMKFPDIFKEELNDAQCTYLKYLIDGDLTVGETGRLFTSRMDFLSAIWSPNYMFQYIDQERQKYDLADLRQIDPIYDRYIKNLKDPWGDPTVQKIRMFLLHNREEYDSQIRRSNRKRDESWQEREEKYIIRYPQTINDFCREGVYMQNCLLTYIGALIENDTTILFMRRADNVNEPFITLEIFDGQLMQAYHRFNRDCDEEEADWIRRYCRRHGIGTGKFTFNAQVDELF